MIDILLIFFATVFIYAGVLTTPQSGQAAAAVAFIGAILGIRPLVHLFRYLRSTYYPRTGSKYGKTSHRGRGHIKIVKSDKEKPPTYH